jgi:lipopolysaccharide/colanic/teichoic acid biosynthesis glycosyltransferase
VSPETQRRIDRLPTTTLAWTRYKTTTLRRDEAIGKPSSDRRSLRAPVLSEALFKGMLIRERKRMERSDRSFALLLVAVDERLSEDPLVVWGPIVEALSICKRDTDVVGWFERGAVVGIILTEIESRDAAVVSGIEARVRRELAHRLDEKAVAAISIQLHAHPDLAHLTTLDPPPSDPLVRLLHARDRRDQNSAFVKRGLDVAGALGLLLMFSPLFVIVAALIKLTSRGPVLFRQARVGEQAKPFRMLKFRTMYTGADPALHQEFVTRFIKTSGGLTDAATAKDAPFKLARDPRITPIGRILRKTSLDELPQFWNVLRGDMSLVGPRPPLSYEVDVYQSWHRRRVLEAKPGITGLWQVEGRSRTTFDDMVRLDLRYARRQSLWTDIKILLATPGAVVNGKGAC